MNPREQLILAGLGAIVLQPGTPMEPVVREILLELLAEYVRDTPAAHPRNWRRTEKNQLVLALT